MEVLVKYENGFRFSAFCKGYTVTTGHGEDGDKKRDGMWPVQLFEASTGMCIGGYIVGKVLHIVLRVSCAVLRINREQNRAFESMSLRQYFGRHGQTLFTTILPFATYKHYMLALPSPITRFVGYRSRLGKGYP